MFTKVFNRHKIDLLVIVFSVAFILGSALSIHAQEEAKTKAELVQEQIQLAEGLRANGELDRALLAYRNAVALDPENSGIPAIRIEIAAIFLEKTEYLNAADEYHTILSEEPSYSEAQLGLDQLYDIFYERGQILSRQDKPDEAIPAYAIAVRAKPSDLKTRLELKDLYVERKRFDEAIEQLGGVLEYTPEDNEKRKELARYLSWRRRFDESTEEYRKVVDQNPGDLEANIGLARVTSWQGNYDEAVEAYQRVLFVDPTFHKARLGIADITSWQGKFDESVKLYRIVLDGDPVVEDRLASLYGLGRVYSWKEEYDKSIEAYEGVFNYSPGDAVANVGIGRVNNWRGDLDEAIVYYNRALETDSLNAEAHLGLGDVYLQQLRVKQASNHFARALDVDPGNEQARQGLVFVRTVKQSSISIGGGYTQTSFGSNNTTSLGINFAYDRTSSVFSGLEIANLYIAPDKGEGTPESLLFNPIFTLSGTVQLPTNTALTLGFSQGFLPEQTGYLQKYQAEVFQSFDVIAFYNNFLDIINNTVLDASYSLALYPTGFTNGDIKVDNLSYVQSLSPGLTYYISPEFSLRTKYGLVFVLNETDASGDPLKYKFLDTPNLIEKWRLS